MGHVNIERNKLYISWPVASARWMVHYSPPPTPDPEPPTHAGEEVAVL